MLFKRAAIVAFSLAVLLALAGCPASVPPTCQAGDVSTQACGVCGTQTRGCANGVFEAWGDCVEPANCGQCTAGETETRPCGNCGAQTRSCAGTAGTWNDWSACAGEGVCSAGAQESQACGTNAGACRPGTATRNCSATCSWTKWGPCGGSYVGPSPEICGDGIDNDCNGKVDEGCQCKPAPPDAGGSFAIAGQITKLVADPKGCFVYALNAASPSQLVVLDEASKGEVTRVNLPGTATDFAVSPSGDRIVAALDSLHKVASIDPSTWNTSEVNANNDPYVVQVSDAGQVFYASVDQWASVDRIDLRVGTDTHLSSWTLYEPALQLSPDGRFLYAGESGISGGNVYKFDVADGGSTLVDRSAWGYAAYGFPYPTRHVYLSPNAHNLYFAGYQLDPSNLGFVRGYTQEPVFAESAGGTFAVGSLHVFDSALIKPVAVLKQPINSAALVAADHELWSYSPQTGRIYYQNVADFVGVGAGLGVREGTPLSLGQYTFTALVRDPARAVLYGLDASRGSVVFIDEPTLSPTLEIFVDSNPTNLSVDSGGSYLYVGLFQSSAFARIDLSRGVYDALVPSSLITYQVQTLASGIVASIDYDQWTTVRLQDGVTGQMLGVVPRLIFQGTLSVAQSGQTLYVGESALSGSNIYRYSLDAGQLFQTSVSTYDGDYGFPYPHRLAVAVPNGSGVFYAGYLLDGADLSVLDYSFLDPVLTVSPDSRLAVTASGVYQVSDGGYLGALPFVGSVQAVSPDSSTLYVADGGAIVKVNLGGF